MASAGLRFALERLRAAYADEDPCEASSGYENYLGQREQTILSIIFVMNPFISIRNAYHLAERLGLPGVPCAEYVMRYFRKLMNLTVQSPAMTEMILYRSTAQSTRLNQDHVRRIIEAHPPCQECLEHSSRLREFRNRY
ncbi:hypothetical protein BIW11_12530 [Tropilaelaps mercedesae]|uniref:Uncharacterized protein n=1 Tax=Tropilaelaps mercedesae TaxID=418985 RepID=A0A1V9X5Y6_9ACAR|nr:hypothetical protein BIW11_12530 [Tropilaelaps mercedesae]